MMSEEPTELETLRRENELLRAKLVASQSDLEDYRREANKVFAKLANPRPYTAEEIQEFISAPRGQPLLEVIEEYERELKGA